MKMAELRHEIASLSPACQNKLAAFLLHLRMQNDAAWHAEMTRRIDDKTPSNWIELKNRKRELRSVNNWIPQHKK